MGLIFVVFVAAYALTGLVMDGAAAVRGKPIPSTLRREARQKAREHRQKNPGYLGTIWNNALESWADASTRRHRRRIAKREAQEGKKSAAWIAKQIAKEEKWAARRQKFADKFGVLWGKARDAAANVHERRREDEAWAANARFDAERDTNVPAGLKGSTDLDADEDEEDEGATVLPFRPRSDSEAEVDDADSAAPRRDPGRCSWGEWEGDAPCTAYRHPGYEHCYDHLQQHQNRCTWGETERCRKPRLAGSPLCAEHHTADEKVQQAVESTLEFAERQRDLNGDTPRTTVTELSCCYGELPGREDCPSTRLWDSPFCAEHEAEWQRRRQELESASLQVYANPHHEALVNPALPCEWSGGPKGPRESCSQPRKSGWPMCAEHLARTDEQLRRAGEPPFTPELAKWIAEWDDQVLAHISGPPDTGQDNPAIKEEVNVSNAAGISGEINDLSSGIELARQMRRYITDLQNTLETLQATMEQTSTGLRQVPASLELASASLQTHGLNGPALEELTVARERASMVSSALAEAVAALSSVPDHLTIANDSFSRMEGELSSQLGISEQVGAAAARGGVARETDFYLRG